MTIPISAPVRTDPDPIGTDDPAFYEGWLDYHRDTLLWKCSRLTAEQLCTRAVPTSSLSLLGIVRHLTEVERGWFRRSIDGQDIPPPYSTPQAPDDDFDATDPARAADDVAAYRSEILEAKRAAGLHSLDDLTVPRPGRPDRLSLRWVYLHLLEEYARHNGHADLLREAIDGATGE